jgi:hypothetical protein
MKYSIETYLNKIKESDMSLSMIFDFSAIVGEYLLVTDVNTIPNNVFFELEFVTNKMANFAYRNNLPTEISNYIVDEIYNSSSVIAIIIKEQRHISRLEWIIKLRDSMLLFHRFNAV